MPAKAPNFTAYESRTTPIDPELDGPDAEFMEEQEKQADKSASSFRDLPFLEKADLSSLSHEELYDRKELPVDSVAPLKMTMIAGRPTFDLIHALHKVSGWGLPDMLRFDWRAAFLAAETLSIQHLKRFGRVYWEASNQGYFIPWTTFSQFELFMRAREGYLDTNEVIEDMRRAHNSTVRVVVAAERIFAVLIECGKGKLTASEIWKKTQGMPVDARKHGLEYLTGEGRVVRSSFKSGERGAPTDLYELAWT